MQAIITKYLGPTNYRGSRIKATSASGLSVTVSYRSELSSEENHIAAAKALCKKYDWDAYHLHIGDLKSGHVFVLGGWLKENPSWKS